MRAKKSRCATCGRVIATGKPCPLAPHIVMKNGPVRVLRPIR
jgi:hypothetical protein